jgi:antirestriction protein
MSIEIELKWERGGDVYTESYDFDECEGLLSVIAYQVESSTDDLNDDLDVDEEEWEPAGWSIIDWDDHYGDPNDFDSLDDYGAFAEQVEKHGQAYRLRYEDVGEHDFYNEYCGSWDSEESYAQAAYADCYNIPDHLESYIDWERLARDIMMDYSSYEDDDGSIHIFRN